MRHVPTLAAIALSCLAAPAASEDIQVLVRNDSGVPKAVPVYWIIDGESGQDVTNSQGKTNITLDCKKTFRVYIRVEDLMARSIAPKSHVKCPLKKEMSFIVRQD